MKYTVRITEELVRDVEIEADSPEEAEYKAEDMYHDQEIILTSDDYVGEPIIEAVNL